MIARLKTLIRKGLLYTSVLSELEVNFDPLLLFLYGLECSTVVGRGGVVCEYCCMFFSNICLVGDGSTILSI